MNESLFSCCFHAVIMDTSAARPFCHQDHGLQSKFTLRNLVSLTCHTVNAEASCVLSGTSTQWGGLRLCAFLGTSRYGGRIVHLALPCALEAANYLLVYSEWAFVQLSTLAGHVHNSSKWNQVRIISEHGTCKHKQQSVYNSKADNANDHCLVRKQLRDLLDATRMHEHDCFRDGDATECTHHILVSCLQTYI